MVALAEASGDPELLAIAHLRRLEDLFQTGSRVDIDSVVSRVLDIAEGLNQPYFLWRAIAWDTLRLIVDENLAGAELRIHDGLAAWNGLPPSDPRCVRRSSSPASASNRDARGMRRPTSGACSNASGRFRATDASTPYCSPSGDATPAPRRSWRGTRSTVSAGHPTTRVRSTASWPAPALKPSWTRDVVTVPFAPERLRLAKRAFTTPRVPFEDFYDGAHSLWLTSGPVRPRPGDVVLAQVERIGQHGRIELPDGRRSRLHLGDEILVVYGDRYAPDQFEAHVPTDLGPTSLVASGGVAAEVLPAAVPSVGPRTSFPSGSSRTASVSPSTSAVSASPSTSRRCLGRAPSRSSAPP